MALQQNPPFVSFMFKSVVLSSKFHHMIPLLYIFVTIATLWIKLLILPAEHSFGDVS